MVDCLFCKIVAGEIPATVVLDGDGWLAFEDIDPKAPVHVLVVPKRHLADIGELGTDPAAAASLVAGIGAVARELGLSAYRTVFNTGAEAGQSVFHTHAHVLGGRNLSWPPG
ncbi:MAG TPA: histidine triad nucleotide-binding protein [Jatrophihabitans sp.]|jgi:histidine triad (HIT) family protein|uniref:histidine triad nucleotide-binding protein n=1 Tax=Jatrophihabitans sp. TaxID=1932789 RepID=UPI002EEF2DE1